MTEKQQASLRAKAEKQTQRQTREEEREQALRERAGAAKSERAKRRLLHRAERHQIRANAHKVRGKQLVERAEGRINDQEWKRIGRSRRNHRLYDTISAVTRRFLPKNPLREEGMEFQHEEAKFTNQGRIFLGGTKAMNLFKDEAGKQWLCKEAVTCVGTYKPMGALVTEAASRLQDQISPETAIHSFAYRGKDGRVLGSLQERLDVKKDAFDLFKWQSDTSKPLPGHLPNQILREHVTDWLLCNFDTKGENFLEDSQGRLRGIDKEQALSFLDHKDAQHMSYQFSPNPNKTLYNSIFELYAQGKLDLDLDLNQVDQYISTVEAIPNEKYLNIFHEVVEAKCKGNPRKMEQMNAQILSRKELLRSEYQRFFGQLALERGAKDLVGPGGEFVFSSGGPEKQGPAADLKNQGLAGPRIQGRAMTGPRIQEYAAGPQRQGYTVFGPGGQEYAAGPQEQEYAAGPQREGYTVIGPRGQRPAASTKKQGPAAGAKAQEPAAGTEKQGPAAPQEQLDRSRYEKPLTMKESLEAQRLHTLLARAARSISRQMKQPELTPARRDALGEVKTTVETIKDYNAKRLAGRITPEESLAFHQLLDPAHAEKSGARPEVVKLTQDLHHAMAPERDISVKSPPNPPVREAPQLSKHPPSPPSLGRR